MHRFKVMLGLTICVHVPGFQEQLRCFYEAGGDFLKAENLYRQSHFSNFISCLDDGKNRAYFCHVKKRYFRVI